MKITARDIDRFLAKPPADLVLALFYGRDLGLISERAATLAQNSVADVNDPFASTQLNGESIAQDATLLYDAAAAIPATGDKRLVRVAGVTDVLLGAVKNLLDNPPAQSITIMTASGLNTKSALVKRVEGDKRGAAIGCYADEARDIVRMAQEIFSKHNIKTDPDVLAWISGRLGADHLLTRSELEKLATMAGTDGHIGLSLAQHALGDSAAASGYAVAAAAANGDMKTLLRCFDRAMADAIAPEAILRIAMSHFGRLFRLSVMMADNNMSATVAVNSYTPPIFFNEKKQIIAALNKWQAKKAMRGVERLMLAEKQARQGIPPASVTAQALIALCEMGRRG